MHAPNLFLNFSPYFQWLVSLGQNGEEVCCRDKVEPGEDQSLGLQVLCQGLLTHREPRVVTMWRVWCDVRTYYGSLCLNGFQLFEKSRLVADLHHIRSLLSCSHQVLNLQLL